VSNGFDRVKTVIDCDPELFDEAVAHAIKAARQGAQVIHTRFDTQRDEQGVIVYIAHILIRDRKEKKEEVGA
jgi:hypothetical protein